MKTRQVAMALGSAIRLAASCSAQANNELPGEIPGHEIAEGVRNPMAKAYS
jgi:hypothetical protein